MGFRIAVVQPIANPIEEAENNIADAVNFIARAKSEGADFVCFPETYPGHGACRQLSIRHRVSRNCGKARHQYDLRHDRAAQSQ